MTGVKNRKQQVASEALINDAPRLLESFDVGDVSHQGDLVLVRISKLPLSAQRRKRRQLAPGNTPGSRHVLKRGAAYDCESSEVAWLIRLATGCTVEIAYIGPVFVSPDNSTANDLAHPEHGNQGFPAGAVVAVVYQRNWDHEQAQARRTLD
jgi:hypothetical protein